MVLKRRFLYGLYHWYLRNFFLYVNYHWYLRFITILYIYWYLREICPYIIYHWYLREGFIVIVNRVMHSALVGAGIERRE